MRTPIDLHYTSHCSTMRLKALIALVSCVCCATALPIVPESAPEDLATDPETYDAVEDYVESDDTVDEANDIVDGLGYDGAAGGGTEHIAESVDVDARTAVGSPPWRTDRRRPGKPSRSRGGVGSRPRRIFWGPKKESTTRRSTGGGFKFPCDWNPFGAHCPRSPAFRPRSVVHAEATS